MMQIGTKIRSHAALIPATAVIGIFMIVPILIILVYSFLAPGDYGGVKPEFSADAYQRLLFQRDLFDQMVFDPAYLKIAFRSVWVAVVSVVGCLALGFPVAYYIACQSEERRNIYLLLITIRSGPTF